MSAGRRRVALPFGLVREFCEVGPRVFVPGAAPWCLGLVQWRGRLLTLLDAGRLCGEQPATPRYLVVLSHAEVETALAVDDLLDLCSDAVPCDLLLDEDKLRELGILRAGAAGQGDDPAEAAR